MATILEDGGITDDPFAWDPLRDLKIQGPQDGLGLGQKWGSMKRLNPENPETLGDVAGGEIKIRKLTRCLDV